MVGFNSNNISPTDLTVAEQLKTQRENKGLSIKKISRKININPNHIQALEKEDYNKLPKGVYQTKILKKYASFLELDVQEIEKRFLKEKDVLDSSKNTSLFSVKKIKKGNLLILPKIIRNTLVGLAIGVCFVYLGVYLNGVFSPPKLVVLNPEKNSFVTEEKSITIHGKTHPETEVFINNNSVLSDSAGFFEKDVNLKQEINIITVRAQKKYGPEKVVKKQILVE